jgi:soluble lytic murein transglycosylase
MLPTAALLFHLLTPSARALPADLADAVATGHCPPVLAALTAPTDPSERLALGWCLRRTDPAAALAHLPATGSGPIAEYGRWQRAEVLVELQRPAEALDALGSLTLPGLAGERVRVLRARALIALHRSLEARDDLRALLDTPIGDEARYWLAFGAEDRADHPPAISTYQTTWARSTRGPWSDLAAAALRRLGQPAPEHGTAAGRALVEQRIASLQSAQRHDEALELLLGNRAADPKPPDDALAWAYFRARKYEEAVRTWTGLLGAGPAAQGAPEPLFHLALALSRTGDYAGSAVVYQRVSELHPDSREGDEASYKLGYLHYDGGACEPAIAAFEQHLVRYPSSAHRDSALWFAGRCHWTLGRLDEAVATWARLVEQAPTSSLAPAVAYWTARRIGLRGDSKAEAEALRLVVQKYPESGHAWFASKRLGMDFPARPAVSPPPWPDALATHPAVRRARPLLDAGFRAWAVDELRPIAPIAKTAGREAALAAAHALITAGDYQAGKRLAAPYCGPAWSGGDPVAQQACYPRPERQIVTRAANRYGLTPLLPYGIMWSESAMDPSVTSIAGARGLMQLMPREGDRLHNEAFGAGTFHPDDLYRAPYNATLGTTELGLKRQSLGEVLSHDSLPAVIAAYNGGEEAVRRWLAGYEGTPEFDTFAEEISFTETRRYVRGVLGHLMSYRWVYGD